MLLDLLGYSRDEILSGRIPWGSLTPPEWRDVDARALAQLEASGIAGLREKEYVRKDGKRVPVMAGSAMLDRETGECISFILDLTERKEAQAAIERMREEREVESRLAALVDASDDAIIGKTLEGVITSWNPGAQRIFGYEAHEVVGRSITLLVPLERQDEEPTILATVAQAARSFKRFDTVRRRKDGSEIDVSVTISPVWDVAGHVVGISKVARDITQRKQAEEALAHAKDAAEAASRELEAFSYSVAHDLRAPLRGMNGFAQLLLDIYGDKLDAEGQDWLHEILLNNNERKWALADRRPALALPGDEERARQTRGPVDLSGARSGGRSSEVTAAAGALTEHDGRGRRSGESPRPDGRPSRPDAHRESRPELLEVHQQGAVGAHRGRRDERGRRTGLLREGRRRGLRHGAREQDVRPVPQAAHGRRVPGYRDRAFATVQRIVQRHGGRIWAEGARHGSRARHSSLPSPEDPGRGSTTCTR